MIEQYNKTTPCPECGIYFCTNKDGTCVGVVYKDWVHMCGSPPCATCHERAAEAARLARERRQLEYENYILDIITGVKTD